jgi:DNA (cytosine-5)-methyltransferase 1
MRAGSLFSGIGGFDLALERAGVEVAWQVELDDHCRRVLARHWPDVARYRDVRHVHQQRRARCPNCLPAVDVLVGGFPCQDVSVAGRRAGLAGERSGLWFEFHRLAAQLRPRWVVIENVPGLLSSNGGRDFGVIIRGLVELGYGVAWRVLDAQYFGVAQRRRRVFVVGCLGDPARAAQVLLEPESCGGHPPPRREARARVAGTLAGGPTGPRGPGHGARSGQTKDDNLVNAFVGHAGRNDPNAETFVPALTPCLPAYGGPRGTTNNPQFDDRAIIVGALTGHKDRGGWRAGPDGAAANQIVAAPLTDDPYADRAAEESNLAQAMSVRRLTPTECERLQGFPDGWTALESDSARYRMLGNAVAVPVVEWIARRLVHLTPNPTPRFEARTEAAEGAARREA